MSEVADALDRPVPGILLEDVEQRYGLQMMMTQYQMLDIRTRDFRDRLRQAVRRMFVESGASGLKGGPVFVRG
jgi:hypothetical protein